MSSTRVLLASIVLVSVLVLAFADDAAVAPFATITLDSPEAPVAAAIPTPTSSSSSSLPVSPAGAVVAPVPTVGEAAFAPQETTTFVPQDTVPCTYSAGGVTFNLNGLKGSDITGKSTDAYQYTMNVCGGAGGVCASKSYTPLVCQANAGLFESVLAYGSSDKTPNVAWDLIDVAAPTKGVKATFKNGDYCWASPTKTRETVISYRCDPSAGTRPSTFTISESPACSFHIDYPNAYVCPGGGATGGDSGGMSGGSAFILTLFIIAVVYIAGGCLYKRRKMGTVGMAESMPNIDFWREIPSLVKDGIMFTRRKIDDCRSGRGGVTRANYDQL